MFRAIAGIATFVGTVIAIVVGLQTLGVGRGSAAMPDASHSATALPPGTCKQGYVWREANVANPFGGPTDHVCVTSDVRDLARRDNLASGARHVNGSDTCVQGYVWRETFQGDHVCVVPATRDQAARDNQAASSRVAILSTGVGI